MEDPVAITPEASTTLTPEQLDQILIHYQVILPPTVISRKQGYSSIWPPLSTVLETLNDVENMDPDLIPGALMYHQERVPRLEGLINDTRVSIERCGPLPALLGQLKRLEGDLQSSLKKIPELQIQLSKST